MTYTRANDPAAALQAAATTLAGRRRDRCACDDQAVAERVLEVAERYLAWLRQLASGRLVLVAIEEIDTGAIAHTPTGGESTMDAVINSGQRARWTFHAKDIHGFEADYALAARSSDEAVATVEYFQVGDAGNKTNGATNPDGTPAEFDQVLATFAGTFGASTIEVYDPAGDTTVVIASAGVTAGPAEVGTGDLGTPVIEPIPA